MQRKSYFLKLSRLLLTLVLTVSLSAPVLAGGGGSDEPFNAGDMIKHHVLDQHEIHFFPGATLYLPVILYSEDGLEIFSSSHFYHSPHEVEIEGKKETYYTHGDYVLFHEHIYKLGGHEVEFENGHIHTEASVLDFSITKNVFGMILGTIIMFLVFMAVAKGYRKNRGHAPKGIQSFLEPLILFVRDEVAKPSIGHHYAKFMPFLLTIFFFIWIGNMLGLIPILGGLNYSGNIAVTLVLAIFTFVITTINGNKGYWLHIVAPPGVPFWLLPIMVPIEILGVFSKPFVLMLRLFANITAGHIILLAFTSLIFVFSSNGEAVGAGFGVSIGTTLFSVFMTFLELLVAFLQAYVFTLLSALYFGMATEEAHH